MALAALGRGVGVGERPGGPRRARGVRIKRARTTIEIVTRVGGVYRAVAPAVSHMAFSRLPLVLFVCALVGCSYDRSVPDGGAAGAAGGARRAWGALPGVPLSF
jgi:hypothetical protein